MKRTLFLVLLFALLQLVFSVGFLTGFFSGHMVRAARPAPAVAPGEIPCTCVQCLPDLFCLKCGHKSRDCPKLAHIFKKGTNINNAASAPLK